MSNYRVFEAGAPSLWWSGEFPHPAFAKPVRGKQFLSEALKLTGMEVSLNTLKAGFSVPFTHSHKHHEELYLFLSGQGEMLIDDVVVPVTAGTAVSVEPCARRTWRNSGSEPLTYIVVQARAGSLADRTIRDGVPQAEPPVWPD